MKALKPLSVPQVKFATAPPVLMMYCFPAATKSATFAAANWAPSMPPQFSAPHSPVANAHVSTGEGIATVIGWGVPLAAALRIFNVFQSQLEVTSL